MRTCDFWLFSEDKFSLGVDGNSRIIIEALAEVEKDGLAFVFRKMAEERWKKCIRTEEGGRELRRIGACRFKRLNKYISKKLCTSLSVTF